MWLSNNKSMQEVKCSTVFINTWAARDPPAFFSISVTQFTINKPLELQEHLLWVWAALACLWEWNMHQPSSQTFSEKRLSTKEKLSGLCAVFLKIQKLDCFYQKKKKHFSNIIVSEKLQVDFPPNRAALFSRHILASPYLK